MWNIPGICGNCFSLGESAFLSLGESSTGPVLYKNLALQNNQMVLKYTGGCLGIFLRFMEAVSALLSPLFFADKARFPESCLHNQDIQKTSSIGPVSNDNL